MKYGRTFNFSAGPAMMPEPVLEEIRDEMMNYRGSGMCVMEMSHRSKVFQQIIDEAEADLRDLMGIPDNYKVLFIQGGATLQFAAVAWNLMKNGKAVYIETGAWSKKAIAVPLPAHRAAVRGGGRHGLRRDERRQRGGGAAVFAGRDRIQRHPAAGGEGTVKGVPDISAEPCGYTGSRQNGPSGRAVRRTAP